MSWFILFLCIFYIGSFGGFLIEIIYRRFAHKKWVNPGSLVGPYTPMYGFALMTLTGVYLIFKNLEMNPFVVILIMGVAMTLVELIGGFPYINKPNKVWDYSKYWGNYKGIICPLFSFIWTVLSGIYYFFIGPFIINILSYIVDNDILIFILGMLSGIMLIDFICSNKLYKRKTKVNSD